MINIFHRYLMVFNRAVVFAFLVTIPGLLIAQHAIKLDLKLSYKQTSYEFKGKGDLQVDQNNLVTGTISWSVVTVDPRTQSSYEGKMNAVAIYYIRGVYTFEKNLTIYAVSKCDPLNLCPDFNDSYYLQLRGDNTIDGSTLEGPMEGEITGQWQSSPTTPKVFTTSVTDCDGKTTMDHILKVWKMFDGVVPPDKNSPAWNRTGGKMEVIKGDGENGICTVVGYHEQYCGLFKNGKMIQGIFIDDDHTIANDDQIRIDKTEGLSFLMRNRHEQRGFTLAEITYWQNLSFGGMKKVNLLATCTDCHTGQSGELVGTQTYIGGGAGSGYIPDWDIKTTYYRDKGLVNNTNQTIFIRSYSKCKPKLHPGDDMPIEYYDASFIIKPGKNIQWVDFDRRPYDKGTLISSYNYYSITPEEAAKKGCGEYTIYLGQYIK